MDIDKIIKERRQQLHITQDDLAQMAAVGLRTVKEIESGKANPSLKTLEKIAHVLGLELRLEIRRSA